MRRLPTLVRLPLTLVVAVAMLAAGCSSGTTNTTTEATTTTTIPTTTTARMTVLQMVEDANEKIELVPPKQLAEQIESGDVLLIDVRQPSEIQRWGTIAGSVPMPRGHLEWFADPASPFFKHDGVFGDFDRRTVTFCEGGGNGALTAVALQELGYRNVATLKGGIRNWVNSGLPTVAGSESSTGSQ